MTDGLSPGTETAMRPDDTREGNVYGDITARVDDPLFTHPHASMDGHTHTPRSETTGRLINKLDWLMEREDSRRQGRGGVGRRGGRD